MLKKFQIVFVCMLTVFLMTHQTYGNMLTNAFKETKECCKTHKSEKNCCKKATSCNEKKCCAYTAISAVAILQNGLYYSQLFFKLNEKQPNTKTLSFVNSPDYSIWQPPKISLNL